jgi:hypothetical protein
MPARFSAYPPDAAAMVRVIDDGLAYRIGRSPDCELCIDHFSVSRFHAELRHVRGAWLLQDLGSKNGLRVDGNLVRQATLEQTTWFAAGDVYCWFEPLAAADAAVARAQAERRRSTSRSLSTQLSSTHNLATLIPQTLDLILQLTGLERGFVLYAPPGEPLRVHAWRGLESADIAARGFSGSVTAVDRALAERSSMVCCDVEQAPWLGARPSVRLGGIRALVCVPLQVRGDALGAVYVDSRQPGPAITELDVELINTVAEQAAAALSARALQNDVAELLRDAESAGVPAPLWDDLRLRVG